jgi:hypothetical protein
LKEDATKPGSRPYIADFGDIFELRCAARASLVDVQVAPAILEEVLRTNDSTVRDRMARILTLQWWKRLMPEAYREAFEVAAEIGRLHPDWMRKQADHRFHDLLKRDWLSGWWRRVRQHPGNEARCLSEVEGTQVAAAREEAQTLRKLLSQSKIGFDTVDLRSLQAGLSENKPRSHWWRIENCDYYWRQLFLEQSPFCQWIHGTVDIRRVRAEGPEWQRMWLSETDEVRLPCAWLRSAMNILQALRKQSDGTPCDNQLGIYLLDSDVFVTADRIMAAIIRKMRPCSPVPMAEVMQVPGGPAGVTQTMDMLRDMRPCNISRGPSQRTRNKSGLEAPTSSRS